jgi:regulation of enolase protein 1 (concanavalin A-like superfamily)
MYFQEKPMDLIAGCEGKHLTNGLQWLREPAEWDFTSQGLYIEPEARTDFFRMGDNVVDNASFLYVEMEGDFTLVAYTKAQLVGFGDAAAIMVRAREDLWAKLCLERSPIGDISIVSVVTDGNSDDANNELLVEPSCYLRLTRKGNVFGMHYSLDGKVWRFVRTFVLDMPATVMIGIHAQAPSMGGCRVTFTSLDLYPDPITDFRSGE